MELESIRLFWKRKPGKLKRGKLEYAKFGIGKYKARFLKNWKVVDCNIGNLNIENREGRKWEIRKLKSGELEGWKRESG